MTDLKKILTDNDRPRQLRSDEHDRILDRLVALTNEPARSLDSVGDLAAPQAKAAETGATVRDKPSPLELANKPSRRQRWLLAAAAVGLIVGFVGVAIRQSPSSDSVVVEVADDRQDRGTLEPPPIAAVCANELAEVVEALEAWGGVGAWVLVTQEPVPDLAGALVHAITAMEGLDASLIGTAGTLEIELDKLYDARLDRNNRERVVLETLRRMDQSIERLDPTSAWCDRQRFTDAIALEVSG